MVRVFYRSVLAASITCILQGGAIAADLAVNVFGATSDSGQVACILFNKPEEFPDGRPFRSSPWMPAKLHGNTCRFPNIPRGVYVVFAFQDLNGNHKLDFNWLGNPTEPWGVSRNPEGKNHLPPYYEAEFQVTDGVEVTLEIRLNQ